MKVIKKKLPTYRQERCKECGQNIEQVYALDGRCGYFLNWAKDIIASKADNVFHFRQDMNETHSESFQTALFRHELISPLADTAAGEAMLLEAAESGKPLELNGFWIITNKGWEFITSGLAIPRRMVVGLNDNFIKYILPDEDKITFEGLLKLGKGDYSQENYQIRKGKI